MEIADKELCSSDDFFDHVLPGDSTVEFIGIVDSDTIPSVVNTKKFGPRLQYRFVLTNQSWKVQITVWGKDDIDAVKPMVKLNNVLHVDCVSAKERNTTYSLGKNVKVDLTYQSNSVIKVLVDHSLDQEISSELVEIENVLEYDNKNITIEGFVNSEFTQEYVQGSIVAMGGIGARRTRLQVLSRDLDVIGKFPVGCKVQVKGLMVGEKIPYHINVFSMKNILKMEGTPATKAELRRANCVPEKRKLELESPSQEAKQKKSV